jgi:hypothetical protein
MSTAAGSTADRTPARTGKGHPCLRQKAGPMARVRRTAFPGPAAHWSEAPWRCHRVRVVPPRNPPYVTALPRLLAFLLSDGGKGRHAVPRAADGGRPARARNETARRFPHRPESPQGRRAPNAQAGRPPRTLVTVAHRAGRHARRPPDRPVPGVRFEALRRRQTAGRGPACRGASPLRPGHAPHRRKTALSAAALSAFEQVRRSESA